MMKLYAIRVAGGLTEHYHSGGTILIEADRPSRARDKAIKEFGLDPEMMYDPKVAKHGMIFEDSGCC